MIKEWRNLRALQPGGSKGLFAGNHAGDCAGRPVSRRIF